MEERDQPKLCAEPSSYFRSQLGQDRFIFEHLISKRDGVFFEVGALDDEQLSNTYFFEKFLDWSGVLVELQPRFFERLAQMRARSKVFGCGIADQDLDMLWFEAGDRSGLLRYFEHAGIQVLERHYQKAVPKPTFSVQWVRVRPIMDILREA